jgi:hypothetical protein
MGCVLKARVGGWLCLINSAKETVEVIVSTEEQTMMKCITLLCTWWMERNILREREGRSEELYHSFLAWNRMQQR